MSQINLMSGGGEESRPKPGFFGRSFYVSTVILVVVFGIYFGVLYYKNSLENDLASLEAENLAKKDLIVGEKANRIADFADRLNIIGSNLEETSLSPNDPFLRIERVMIPEVNLTSYTYDVSEKEVSITLAADSFRAVAQQIVALKKETVFSSVLIDGDARVATSGKVETTLMLSL